MLVTVHAKHGKQSMGAAGVLSALAGIACHWLSGSQKHTLEESLAAFVGHPAHDTETLRADLHRFTLLPGASDGDGLFGEAAP